MAPFPAAPSMTRSVRAAAQPGLKDTQRSSYLTQFHITQLHNYADEQAAISKRSLANIMLHENTVAQLTGLVKKPNVPKDDINKLLQIHRVRLTAARKEQQAAASNERRARAQISIHTTKNPRLRTDIPAATVFGSLVDDLDTIVYVLDEALPSLTLQTRENDRLRYTLASKNAEIVRLEGHIAYLKVHFLVLTSFFLTPADVTRARRIQMTAS
ncbi:hypothetical protein CTA2_3828 [Colletotrichum tanaceti]|uniref:Uncharacterized protein n=1 Tax=Colletotrichum tanaceti TaxID=1306861 RepID=A0A4U6XK99_9PEZI|nr:hypothetical protein CTA2_3828 [Colletotrichum tanaceti]TKW56119.1 hypothetical protein CTA1_8267 [Colletotrichum tanaceti]